jgi:hypothetical protein
MKLTITNCLASAAVLGSLILPIAAQADSYHHHPHSVNSRLHRQQERIAHGIGNGSLTPAEAARLERREMRLHRQVARDRYFHHGKLTAAERRREERRLNHASHSIYHQKHDWQHTH